MTNKTVVAKMLDKSEKFESQPTGKGTPPCLCTVRIKHSDTLGRQLPKGISVAVYDEHGNEPVVNPINEEGISEHLGVHCGKIFWQLEREDKKDLCPADGRVLIKAKNTITDDEVESGTDNDSPKMQLATPLKLKVAVERAKITAIYLPPPIICNIRKEQPEDNDLLTEEELEQLRRSGANATIFIHGYNVPLGTMGAFGDADNWRKRPPTSQRLTESLRQIPFLYHTHEEITQLEQIRVDKQNQIYHRSHHGLNAPTNMPKAQADYNGTGAYATMLLVENYLNKAAANLDSDNPITDWTQYNRIIGVTWSGDESMREFFKSMLQANLAARRFAKILRQLIGKGIAVNIITHSLGARVALGALNILGDFKGQYKVDNVFLWQPAVADNALSDKRENDKGPTKTTVFPYAHEAVKHISVLYSNNDGVLGGDDTPDSDIAEKFTSAIGGAYPKRFWWIASGTEAMGQYYEEFRPHYHAIGKKYPHEANLTLKQLATREIALAINAEAEKINNNPDTADIKYLSPWAYYRRFTQPQIKEIIRILQTAMFNDFDVQEQNLRPALGHAGDKFTRKIGDKGFDKFIADEYKEGKFYFLDQTTYYMSHSALSLDNDRQYFPTVYEKSYKDEIIFKIKNQSKFGKY